MTGRIFYGWWVVLACATVAVWTGGIFFGITVFITPIVNDFGWTYLAVSLAASIRSVEMGVMAPAAGYLADRLSPKRITFIGGAVGGAGLLMMSFTNSLIMYYVAFFTLSVGFTGLGQAVTTTVVSNWFRRRAGLATGIMVAGYGLGGVILPFMSWLTITYGWRVATLVHALMTWAIVLPVSLLVRDKPEHYGLAVDGERAPTGGVSASAAVPLAREDHTPKSALRTGNFWFLALSFLVQFGVLQAVSLHIVPYCKSVSLTDAAAATIGMMLPLASVIGRLLFGWLGDRFGSKPVLVVGLAIQVGGLAFLSYGYTLWQLAFFLALYAPAFGGTVVLRASAIREYFGRTAFGSIQGLIIGVMTIGGIVGPAYAGWTYDTAGSYQTAWLVMTGATLVAMLFILPVKKT